MLTRGQNVQVKMKCCEDNQQEASLNIQRFQLIGGSAFLGTGRRLGEACQRARVCDSECLKVLHQPRITLLQANSTPLSGACREVAAYGLHVPPSRLVALYHISTTCPSLKSPSFPPPVPTLAFLCLSLLFSTPCLRASAVAQAASVLPLLSLLARIVAFGSHPFEKTALRHNPCEGLLPPAFDKAQSIWIRTASNCT